jgi:hypothetical protein
LFESLQKKKISWTRKRKTIKAPDDRVDQHRTSEGRAAPTQVGVVSFRPLRSLARWFMASRVNGERASRNNKALPATCPCVLLLLRKRARSSIEEMRSAYWPAASRKEPLFLAMVSAAPTKRMISLDSTNNWSRSWWSRRSAYSNSRALFRSATTFVGARALFARQRQQRTWRIRHLSTVAACPDLGFYQTPVVVVVVVVGCWKK